ncbi:MAG: O-antigen ligase family protein [Oscillospiraceae bacterium]|nr:O-antigen ligase family protein [Oscillospiraceae bacterium]
MSEPGLRTDLEASCFRATDIYILTMLFIFPLFTGFEGYANITLAKYIFFATVTALWLAALIIFKLRSGILRGKNAPMAAVPLILIYFVLNCVSALFSPYAESVLLGAGRFDGLITTVLCVGIFWGVSLYARLKKAYIFMAAAAVTINCVVAVLQIFGLNPLWLFPGDYDFFDAGIKFTSTFLGTIGNADLFSAYICLILPVIILFYITSERRSSIFLPVITLNAFCLFSCGVSAGILAFFATALLAAPVVINSGDRLRRTLEAAAAVSIAVFIAASLKISENATLVSVSFVFSFWPVCLAGLTAVFVALRILLRNSEFGPNPMKLFFSLLSASLVITGLTAVYFWKAGEGTVYEFSRVLHGELEDSFGSSRILIWRKTLKLVPESLWLGGGPGTLAQRLDINFSRFVEETGKTLTSSVDNAHNEYLGILVNTGLLSLLAYLAAQILSFVRAVRSEAAAVCLAFALLCYWVQSFFGLGLFLVSPLMWLLWGLLSAELRTSKN